MSDQDWVSPLDIKREVQIEVDRLEHQRRKAIDHALVKVTKATSRADIIGALLAIINDDVLTRDTLRRLVTLLDYVKEFRLKDAL